mmetsp:Transcript_16369/g.20390  ORF Transcript_16369/g.20390 Transcript_16369/m.20390 type:complete len:597 (+) Transcript_16369:358-2148(+)|eukprot:CAMPEP_0172514278 /NCGR_PEP_ID=MMETSP1066-20121228/258861_1 /TAXON_ID=671091 /ORGANISM="Coscinodiscus wailesii, Strain CCMP2513" /LENGTH=596 /DNA_ID=CAMNT_0013294883 /DNA_START=354 /DNA_END=2144 /DNA_ORIENTATION=-
MRLVACNEKLASRFRHKLKCYSNSTIRRSSTILRAENVAQRHILYKTRQSPLHLSRNGNKNLSNVTSGISINVSESVIRQLTRLEYDSSVYNNCLKEQETCPILAISATKISSSSSLLKSLLSRIRKLYRTLRSLLLVLLRGTEISLHLSPLLILTPLTVLETHLLPPSRKNRHDACTPQRHEDRTIEALTWKYAIIAIQNLGPAFVKLSQWAATRRDLFSPYLCNHLGLLHDNARIHSWNDTRDALVRSFGTEYHKILRVTPEGIVGSGSVAQVYRGRLVNGGGGDDDDEVAIKVLHPGIRSRVERDLWLMRYGAHILESVILPADMAECLSLSRAVETFCAVMRDQVDLTVEGRNLKQFGENFGCGVGGEGGRVCFPRVVDGWVSEEVLVESFVGDGSQPVGVFLNDDSHEGMKTRRELARPLLQSFLKMVFTDNFVHCDLHPGNVLVKNDGTIFCLDAGIAASLRPEDRQNLRDLFRAVVTNDGDRVGRLMVQRAKFERCSATPGGVDKFARGMDEIVTEFHDRRRRGLTLGAVKIGSLLGRVLDLCRVHGVEIDPAMAAVVVSTLVLEGLGRSLDPDVNLMECALPFIMGTS